MNLKSLFISVLLFNSFLLNAQVAFHREVKEGKFTLFGINQSNSPLVLNVTLDSLDIRVSQFIENPKDTVILFEVETHQWTDSTDISPWVKASINFGNPNAKPDNYEYLLPFAKGSKFECLQGFKGKFSHSSIASKYAVDFKMPIGTPIHAARGGKVIYTKEDSDEGGNNREKFINKANKIMIYHDDGTVSNYVHLMQNGVEVEEGDLVKAGQLIGYSGNTGFTTTPHLHFVVRVLRDAVKINFKGIRKSPREGRTYKH